MEEFVHIFEGVADPRRSNATLHDPDGMPMIGLLSALCGGESCADMEHFRLRKLHCGQCPTRRMGGETEYFHGFVRASMVAPGQSRALPLPPEFVRPRDGTGKRDCGSRAARRWLARVGPSMVGLRPVHSGDDLYSRQPLCEAVQAAGGNFIFVCRPSSHRTLGEYLRGTELQEIRRTAGRGAAKRLHRYRWMADPPLRDSADALRVTWLEVGISRPGGRVTYRNGFVTDLDVTHDNVAEIAACGRARWRIGNETFNVPETNGYNLEHNFGHGRDGLANLPVVPDPPAFAAYTRPQPG